MRAWKSTGARAMRLGSAICSAVSSICTNRVFRSETSWRKVEMKASRVGRFSRSSGSVMNSLAIPTEFRREATSWAR